MVLIELVKILPHGREQRLRVRQPLGSPLNALAAYEQEGRYTSDAWEEMIADHIVTLSSVGVAEILTGVLKLEPADWDQPPWLSRGNDSLLLRNFPKHPANFLKI